MANNGDRIYPCADCGAMRSKDEGGTGTQGVSIRALQLTSAQMNIDATIKFHLGLVTNGKGAGLEDEGYITYGKSSHPDHEIGEITVRGKGGALVAAKIVDLLNSN